ncbi:MAG: hypothetical protein ACQEQL_01920 [Pseudomonadota bacterium]
MAKRVFHLVHGDFKGEALNPSQANDLDPQAYVYAAGLETPDDTVDSKFTTKVPTECLPYCSPNGTRIMNHTDEEQGYTITLLPDRDAFLKKLESGEREFHGVIYELPADKFSQSPRHKTQYISPEPIPFTEMRKVAEINSLEDAMQLGLHILFTHEPHTPENHSFYQDIFNAPDFPHNLKSYVADGTFTYENEEKGIQPLAMIAPAADQPKSDPVLSRPLPKAPPPAPPGAK